MVRKYGRRKTVMVKIKNEKNLQATFSKRKSSLFKKASELCTLCDAKLALIVFSPSGKCFSFGHPDVYELLDRFSSPGDSPNTEHVDSNTNSHLQDLNDKLTQVLAEEEKEIEKKKMYKVMKNERSNNNSENSWYGKPTEELNLTEVIHLKNAAEDLKKKIDDINSEFEQRMITHLNYYVGSSSNVAPDCAVNRTPWYNHSQIQSQEPEQGHCQDGPRYYQFFSHDV